MPTASPLSKSFRITSWILQLGVVALLGLAVFPKLSGAPETKFLFETLGMEPMGRYAIGIAELLAVVLLLVPRTTVFGALLALGIITGALGSHLTKLGIQVDMPDGTNDGGAMFGMAVVVFLASLAILTIRRAQLPVIGGMFNRPSASV